MLNKPMLSQRFLKITLLAADSVSGIILYFKILPAGSANVPGILIGMPSLDCAPFGLGHQIKEQTHFFKALGIHMPRMELGRRAQMKKDLVEWHKTGFSNPLPGEHCNILREAEAAAWN